MFSGTQRTSSTQRASTAVDGLSMRTSPDRIPWVSTAFRHGFDMIRPGARVSRNAIQFLRDRFAYAVDHDFAKQP